MARNGRGLPPLLLDLLSVYRAPAMAARATLSWVKTNRGMAALVVPTVLGLIIFTIPLMGWLLDNWLNNNYYGHGLLVIPVALAVAWLRRRDFMAQPKEIHDVDLAWLGAGGALLVTGRIMNSNFIQAWGLLPLAIGVILATQGRKRTRLLVWPLGFTAMVIPLPLLEWVFGPMQAIAAGGAGRIAELFGNEVVYFAATLNVNGYLFSVVPLCAGLSSTVALYSVTAVLTLLMPVSFMGRVMAFAMVAPVAIAANIGRITTTMLSVVHLGGPEVFDLVHGIGGIVSFALAVGTIVAIVAWTGRWRPRRPLGGEPVADR